jgi:hypothetical protein
VVAGRVEGAVDVRAERARGQEQFQVHPARCHTDLGCVQQGAAGQQRAGHCVTLEVPLNGPPFPVIGAGVGAGGQSLADTWCAITDSDVPVPAHRVGELDDPAVLPGDLERDQGPRWAG